MRTWEANPIVPDAFSIQMLVYAIIAIPYLNGNKMLCYFVGIISAYNLISIIINWRLLWRNENFKSRLMQRIKFCKWYWQLRVLRCIIVVVTLVLCFQPYFYANNDYVEDYNYLIDSLDDGAFKSITRDLHVILPRPLVEAAAFSGYALRYLDEVASQAKIEADSSEELVNSTLNAVGVEWSLGVIKVTMNGLQRRFTCLIILYILNDILRTVTKYLVVRKAQKLEIAFLT